jgi:hypothetical protein
VKDLHRGILELFAEAQSWAHDVGFGTGSRNWDARRRVAKSLDNAEQYKKIKCDKNKHAARLERRRSSYDPAKRRDKYLARKAAA